METLELGLKLRRDRGYVYFPDAIASTLTSFGLKAAGPVRAECYRTSSRRIVATEIDGQVAREELFGLIECGPRRFALRETSFENSARYDLPEPVFDCRMTETMMEVKDSTPFLSRYHRWAAACKKLFHFADPTADQRMLVQRMEAFDSADRVAEKFTLDFLTVEKFMKFSIWHNDVLAGQVIAAAKAVR